MISKAEGIYYQMVEAVHLTDAIRLILGLPILGNSDSSHNSSPASCTYVDSTLTNTSAVGDEEGYERAINTSYL